MSNTIDSEAIERAAHLIAQADHLLISAGAGIGVDSGLPDFRGNEGFWNAYPPYRDKGLSFSSMADPRWFTEDPEFAWGFYGHRLALYRETNPHRGFTMMLDWAQGKRSYFVFTSNVDGQFQKAGFDGARLYEVHGSIHHLQCATPCNDDVYPADGAVVTVDERTMRAKPPLPRCPGCGGLARPNILMFGDFSYLATREQDQALAYQAWLEATRGDAVTVIEVGAGSAVPTVRYESEQLAQGQRGAALVRLNPREPQVPHGRRCVGLPSGGLTALERIAALIS